MRAIHASGDGGFRLCQPHRKNGFGYPTPKLICIQSVSVAGSFGLVASRLVLPISLIIFAAKQESLLCSSTD